MSNDRKISVAIATYNRAHIIPETLGCILGQAYPPSEIVIVDDGSSDGTREAIEAVSKDIVYIKIENCGPGTALKKAIERCSNEWIALCDDDDRWRPEHLSRRVRLLDAYPEVDYTFSNFSSFGPDSRPNYDAFADIPPGWMKSFPKPDADGFQDLGHDLLGPFLRNNPVFPTSTCFSRELYERCGGIDPQFSRLGCWDAHLTWRFVLHGRVACDHRITVETRRHGGSFSRKKSRVYTQRAEMLRQAWRDGWIPPKYGSDIEQAIVDSNIEAAQWAWNEKDHRYFREIASKSSIRTFPRALQLRLIYSWLMSLSPRA
ncbi:MAG: glycosyltransferase [Burkholderiales bacterium]|nr:glycosyltransferase [Burkholderiales bacterium]